MVLLKPKTVIAGNGVKASLSFSESRKKHHTDVGLSDIIVKYVPALLSAEHLSLKAMYHM